MGRVPNPRRTMTGELRKAREQTRAVSNSSPFFGTGVHPNGVGGLDSDTYVAGTEGFSLKGTGDVELNGNLDVNGSSRVDGPMTVNGNLDVTGAFTLPVNSILNAWLASQVGWGAVAADSSTGWSTSTSMSNKAATSITVPAGYDTALVVAWGMVTFQDSAPNRFDCRCVIEGNSGPTLINLANLVGQSTVLHSRAIAVSPGQVLNLSVQVLSAVATGGAAANTAVCGGVALFSR